MRRSKLPRKIRRCRNAWGTGHGGSADMFGVRLEPDPLPDSYELTFEPNITARQRAFVLDHGGLFCKMCGVSPGDIDDLTGCEAKFHVGRVVDPSQECEDKLSNFRVICTTCDEGAKSITAVKPPVIWLLSQIRRAGQDEQHAVLDWLLKKFKE